LAVLCFFQSKQFLCNKGIEDNFLVNIKIPTTIVRSNSVFSPSYKILNSDQVISNPSENCILRKFLTPYFTGEQAEKKNIDQELFFTTQKKNQNVIPTV
jgi:hypothetical protein